MFPCSIIGNSYSLADQTNEENPNLKEKQHMHYSSSCLHFPEPFLEDDELFFNYLLSQNHLLVSEIPHQNPTESNRFMVPNLEEEDINNGITNNTAAKLQQISLVPTLKKKDKAAKETLIPRKRSTGKKDRHSKIYTAQGPRDRRMRLSLHIARKFFDLQDMLGFDKASQTIEWLLAKSMASIQEVSENFSKVKQRSSVGAKSVLSTAESEQVVASKVVVEIGDISHRKVENLIGMAREKKIRKLHKVAKESRDIARARARERTREKIKGIEKSKDGVQENPSKSAGVENYVSAARK